MNFSLCVLKTDKFNIIILQKYTSLFKLIISCKTCVCNCVKIKIFPQYIKILHNEHLLLL